MAPLTQSLLRAADRISGSNQASSQRTVRSIAGPYLLAILLVGLALALKATPLPGVGQEAPAALLIGAILVVALAGGWVPGTFATLLALGGVVAFFPPGDEARTSGSTATFAVAFLAEAALVIALAELVRRAAANLLAENRRQTALADIAGVALTSRDDPELWAAVTERLASALNADAVLALPVERGESPAAAWPLELATNERTTYQSLNPEGQRQSWTFVADRRGEETPVEGFRAGLVAPIEGDGPRGVILALLRHRPLPFTESDKRFLETVAPVLRASRERRESERALERSEERLRVAQSAASVGTWEWDLASRQMAWSDGLEILHGLPPGTFPTTSEGYLSLVHPDDRAKLTEAAQGTRDSDRFDIRYRVELPDGRERWVSSRGQAFFDADGHPTRVVGVIADLTEQVRAEEAVKASERRFRLMTNVAPVLIRVANPSGACIFVNERWSVFTGRPAEHQLGDAWLSSVHPDDLGIWHAVQTEALQARVPTEVEYRIKAANGDYRWVLDRQVPVETEGEGFVGFVSSCTDISDRRRAEDALRLAADSGEQLASSLDLNETLGGLARLAVPRFADWCVVFLKEDAETIKRVSTVHRDPGQAAATERLARYDHLSLEGPSVAAHVIRTGEPLLAKDVSPGQVADAAADDEHRHLLEELGARSILGVPLKVQDQTIGAMVFVRGESTSAFHDADLTLARDLARRASVSIENARLYSDLVERESAVAQANETLTFLLEASAELSETLDLDEMMASLTRLATPRVADWCSILSLNDSQQPVVRAASHRDPNWSERVRELQERYPFNPRANAVVMRALRDGEPAFVPVIREADMAAAATTEEHLALIKRLGLRSAVIVPLKGARANYGAMNFVMSESGRQYTEEDFATLQDLAHRAVIAMDNATLYREAQEREQDLRRANEAKDEFLGMMSHELRTPLTVINGGARVLRARSAELDSESRESILADIEGESDRLFRMVENLLALAHLEFGEVFDVEPVHATRLAEKVVAAFRTRRPNREVVLDVQPGAETFAAQPVYLEQVIRNLLSNADKYSPQGKPITIQVRRVSEGVGEFCVQDRGVGVDADEVDLIFERFYRSERTSRLVGGSGVGLALCKRLIEAMSGHIWARPRDGGGLEVGFSLPLYEEAFV